MPVKWQNRKIDTAECKKTKKMLNQSVQNDDKMVR